MIRWLLCFLLCFAGLGGVLALAAPPTPGFLFSTKNVSISGQGTAASEFTLTSIDGFTGQVGVTCVGPDANLVPDLVLPVCSSSSQILTVPADGSVSGSINFYPPWQAGSAMNSASGSGIARPPLPLIAGFFVGVGLLGLRLRRILERRVAIVIGAMCLGLMAGVIGCLGNGGLQMTPGTYTYTLTASGASTSISKTISVTVQCNSCP